MSPRTRPSAPPRGAEKPTENSKVVSDIERTRQREKKQRGFLTGRSRFGRAVVETLGRRVHLATVDRGISRVAVEREAVPALWTADRMPETRKPRAKAGDGESKLTEATWRRKVRPSLKPCRPSSPSLPPPTTTSAAVTTSTASTTAVHDARNSVVLGGEHDVVIPPHGR